MLMRLRAAGLVSASVAMLVALAVLIGLGTWQMQRRAWKNALTAQIVARTHAPPISIEAAKRQLEQGADIEYTRVEVRGTFLDQSERLLYAPDQQLGPGYHVYTPLELGSGLGCSDFVMVNRGFVPERLKTVAQRAAAGSAAGSAGGIWTPESGGAAVVGLVRMPERPGMFAPANEPKNNLWFWRDLDGMVASLTQPPMTNRRPSCARGAKPYPFFVDAEAEPVNPGGWPKGGATIVNLANRHLEYALTWYGLALTLVGVYAAFVVGRLKENRGANTARDRD